MRQVTSSTQGTTSEPWTGKQAMWREELCCSAHSLTLHSWSLRARQHSTARRTTTKECSVITCRVVTTWFCSGSRPEDQVRWSLSGHGLSEYILTRLITDSPSTTSSCLLMP